MIAKSGENTPPSHLASQNRVQRMGPYRLRVDRRTSDEDLNSRPPVPYFEKWEELRVDAKPFSTIPQTTMHPIP